MRPRLVDYGTCDNCGYPMRGRNETGLPGTRRRSGPGLCVTCQARLKHEPAYQEWHDPDPSTADGRALIYWLNNHRKATA
jgi:hypothetical protein